MRITCCCSPDTIERSCPVHGTRVSPRHPLGHVNLEELFLKTSKDLNSLRSEFDTILEHVQAGSTMTDTASPHERILRQIYDCAKIGRELAILDDVKDEFTCIMGLAAKALGRE